MEHDHRKLGVLLNRRVWQLLEQPVRSAEQADEMIHAAHGSLWHWLQVGTGANHQRGGWLIGRVYVALAMAEPALRYARQTLVLTDQHRDLLDFDHAFAHELAARAFALAGEGETAGRHRDEARALGAAIADPADRELFFAQFRTEAWFDLGLPAGGDPFS